MKQFSWLLSRIALAILPSPALWPTLTVKKGTDTETVEGVSESSKVGAQMALMTRFAEFCCSPVVSTGRGENAYCH